MIPTDITLEQVNRFIPNTLMEHLGIEYTEVGSDYLVGKMPVDERTFQPMRLLHGGASMALAESVGSAASNLIIDHDKEYAVGMEINANHIRSATGGHVYATAKALHIGRTSHVWDIRIVDDNDKVVCICRMTNAVREKA